ncbi:hypothetical protein [Veillonella magna]|uniref:hypothetical protein n=1 Tax=Veillonella magna TaxID=464322 RepID=UPI0023F34A6A|nr:hypothetical protein [Veillonella magna]
MSEEKERKYDYEKIGAIVESSEKMKANDDLGITKEYSKTNRDVLWDSTKRKKEFKEKIFGEKKVYHDPLSNKVLHKSQAAAQRKYKMKAPDGKNKSTAWASHTAETDHINALKDTHDIVKYNPFLSDKDFREVMNSDSNYRILSKKDNTSKGDKSDWQLIFDSHSDMSLKSRGIMAREKVKADVSIATQFTLRTAENIGQEFSHGVVSALGASKGPLSIAAAKELRMIMSGEKTLKEGVADFSKLSVEVAVVGGAQKVALTGVQGLVKLSDNPIINKIIANNGPAKIIALGYLVKDSAVRLINGEIGIREFVQEVGVSGTMVAGAMVGSSLGAEIGATLGSMVGTILLPGLGTVTGGTIGTLAGEVIGAVLASVVCGAISTVYMAVQEAKAYKHKEAAIRKVADEAMKVMTQQRERFIYLVKADNEKFDCTVSKGFSLLMDGVTGENTDFNKVNEGLNVLLSLVGGKVLFESIEEYERQLDTALELSF